MGSPPPEVLKLVVLEEERPRSRMALCMYALLRRMWEGAEIPRPWEEGVVVPIPKKGDLQDPDNYRGITLLSSAYKLFAKVVTGRLYGIAEREGLLCREQAGFRSREECVSQATVLYEVTRRRSLRGLGTYMVFLDFSKAYDRVPHEALLLKLASVGIGGKLLSAVRAMYSNPRLLVRTGSTSAGAAAYRRGVRQGCPCSPILFDLYVNDLLREVPGVSVPGVGEPIPGLLFADDAVVFGETREDVQRAMDSISAWCDTWEMSLNIAKCGVMHVPGEGQPRDAGIRVRAQGQCVPYTASYTYLGVTVTHDMEMRGMLRKNLEACRRAYFGLARILRPGDVPLFVKRMVLRSVLLPIALYGSELWGMSTARVEELQRVIDLGMRTVLGAGRGTCLVRLRRELGLQTVGCYAAARRVRAFHKWRGSRTWISTLISREATSRKATWVSGTGRWKRRFLGRDDPVAAHNPYRVWAEFADRENRADRSRFSAWARDASLAHGDWWVQIGVLYPGLGKGVRALGLMRVGSFPTGRALACRRVLDSRYLGACPVCECDEAETVEHLLADCPRWEGQRNTAYGEGFTPWIRGLPPAARLRAIGGLLGGELSYGFRLQLPLEPGSPAAWVLATVSFLQEIVPARARIVSSRRLRAPASWNRGPLGTVALGEQ